VSDKERATRQGGYYLIINLKQIKEKFLRIENIIAHMPHTPVKLF